MSFLIRPTDWCKCESGKLYRDCCSRLTKLPKNPSKQSYSGPQTDYGTSSLAELDDSVWLERCYVPHN
jgi:hypothetical protein